MRKTIKYIRLSALFVLSLGAWSIIASLIVVLGFDQQQLLYDIIAPTTTTTSEQQQQQQSRQYTLQIKKKNGKVKKPIRQIVNLTIDDLPGLPEEKVIAVQQQLLQQSSIINTDFKTDKRYIIDTLRDSGIEYFDQATLALLPTQTQFTNLYGQRPTISCPIDNQNKTYAQVAGLFNTGTTALGTYLVANGLAKSQVLSRDNTNVPWGKHRMYSMRQHFINNDTAVDIDPNMLPVVVIRDPYTWLYSTCQNTYTLKWKKSPTNLKECYTTPLYFPTQRNISFDSLLHWYTEYYNEYLEIMNNVVMVRYEDLLYNPKAVIQDLQKCLTTQQQEPFTYLIGASKWDQQQGGKKVQHNMLSALIIAGQGWTRNSTEYGRDHLQTHGEALIKKMNYRID